MEAKDLLTREVLSDELKSFASTTLREELKNFKQQLQDVLEQLQVKQEARDVRPNDDAPQQLLATGGSCPSPCSTPREQQVRDSAKKCIDVVQKWEAVIKADVSQPAKPSADVHAWTTRHVKTYVPGQGQVEGDHYREKREILAKSRQNKVQASIKDTRRAELMDKMRAARHSSSPLEDDIRIPSPPPPVNQIAPERPGGCPEMMDPSRDGFRSVPEDAPVASSLSVSLPGALADFNGKEASGIDAPSGFISEQSAGCDRTLVTDAASHHASHAEDLLKLMQMEQARSQKSCRESHQATDSCDPRDWQHAGDSLSCRDHIGLIIYSWWFEYLFFALIFINAVMMGVESDYSAAHPLEGTPVHFEVIEMIFCTVFTLEVMLRVFVSRMGFFVGPGIYLNLVDLAIVVLQVTMLLVAQLLASQAEGVPNLNVLRLIRLIRLVRIVRAVRMLKAIGEVRAIVWSVGASFKPLCGAVVILTLMSYVLGIYLNEMVINHKIQVPADDPSWAELDEHFGSLPMCILSLWQAISGGVDWKDLSDPLMNHVGGYMGILFSLYIAFCMLALMNTITGVFVDSALQIGKKDKDNYTLGYLRSIFAQMDVDGSGEISWQEFEKNLEEGQLAELLNLIGLDVSEAESMFKLLDLNESGLIDAEEFLAGCIRLRSEAKALDMLVFTRETRRMFGACFSQLNDIQDCLAVLERPGVKLTPRQHNGLPISQLTPRPATASTVATGTGQHLE